MIARHRIAASLVVVLLLTVATVLVARSFAAALERPRLYDYFDEALAGLPVTLPAVTWLDSAAALDRPFEANDAATIGLRLTEAWAAHANALVTGVTDYLPDHFSGVALARATLSAAEPGARMVVLHQTARPTFFHADGSLMQVAAKALTVRFLLKDDRLGAFRVAEDSTVTTLLNEATGWRIFSHELEAVNDLAPARANVEVLDLRGINYYPATEPWSRFWPEFDRSAVARDFALVRSLGSNVVRVFLHRSAFLDPAVAKRDIANLKSLLAEADAASLLVVPTLFDMRSGFEPGYWANDYLWLQTVLPVLAAAPNVAFVDLKNEPNLDYDSHGKGLVQAWLRTMAAVSRRIAPDVALTIGWSNAASAADLVDLVDVVSYHDFLATEGTADRVDDVRRVSQGKPVYITEVGASSWSLALGLPHSPISQARALEGRLAGVAEADGVFVWTLHDFPDPDANAVGASPWRRGLQSAFGLFAPDGSEKPAAAVVRAAFEILSRNDPE